MGNRGFTCTRLESWAQINEDILKDLVPLETNEENEQKRPASHFLVFIKKRRVTFHIFTIF